VIDDATKRAATIVRDLVLLAEHLPLHPTRCQVVAEHEGTILAENGEAGGRSSPSSCPSAAPPSRPSLPA